MSHIEIRVKRIRTRGPQAPGGSLRPSAGSLPMSHLVIRRLRVPHCKRGPARCAACRAGDDVLCHARESGVTDIRLEG